MAVEGSAGGTEMVPGRGYGGWDMDGRSRDGEISCVLKVELT